MAEMSDFYATCVSVICFYEHFLLQKAGENAENPAMQSFANLTTMLSLLLFFYLIDLVIILLSFGHIHHFSSVVSILSHFSVDISDILLHN